MSEVTWLDGTECPGDECSSETFVVDLTNAGAYRESYAVVACADCGYELEFGEDWA